PLRRSHRGPGGPRPRELRPGDGPRARGRGARGRPRGPAPGKPLDVPRLGDEPPGVPRERRPARGLAPGARRTSGRGLPAGARRTPGRRAAATTLVAAAEPLVGPPRRHAASAVPAPAPPSTIGRYEIRGLLGEGATACVYRAFDPLEGREVAVKALK